MKKITMYYNPSCSKCAYALEYLQQQGIEPEYIYYLEQHPTFDELKILVDKLSLHPKNIVRISDPLFVSNYNESDFITPDDWLNLLVKEPSLLQRPILVSENKAFIARDEESIKQALQ